MCLAGASGAGAELLRTLPHPDLRLHFVWVPMLPADDRQAAAAAAQRLAEPRALHYWDGERHLARHLAERLNIGSRESLGVEGGAGFAWDVYLAYGRGSREIGRPAFWMHQLGVTHAPRLNAGEFRRRVEKLFATPPEGQA